jgi:2-oxoisovalerate dehydrogenase E2 component (dihydrolipoyl transacylase)
MPDPATVTSVRDFVVPDLGEGLEDATLVEWRVAPDDQVALNQTLCVLETAKAEVEIPSPFAGRVVECNGAPGDTLDVGTVLARIEVSGSSPSIAPSETTGTANEAEPDDGSGANLVGYGTSTGTSRRRRARLGAGGGRPSVDPPPVVDRTAGEKDARPDTSHARAKPKARQLARELGVDIEALAPGSGPDGTVTRSDVLAAAEAPSVMQDAPSNVRSASQNGVGSSGDGDEDGDEVVPVLGVRARIADHLTRSHTTIPAASASVEVDCTRLLSVRATMNADNVRSGGEPIITPFSLLLRLLVVAVGHNPSLNATYDAEERVIRLHGEVHLGVGTATDRGLVVPVVRSAQRLSALELSSELRRLADAARTASLAPTELVGSTVTVSNFGALGLDDGVPIINAPEAAIVGVGAIRERAVVVDGQIVPRPTATITCSFDHRVSDGTEIGSFLTELRSLIEEPARAL